MPAGTPSRVQQRAPRPALACEVLQAHAYEVGCIEQEALHVRSIRSVEKAHAQRARNEIAPDHRARDFGAPIPELQVSLDELSSQIAASHRAVLDGLRDALAGYRIDARRLTDEHHAPPSERRMKLEPRSAKRLLVYRPSSSPRWRSSAESTS